MGQYNFGATEQFWMNLPARYHREIERDRLGPRLEREVSILKRAS